MGNLSLPWSELSKRSDVISYTQPELATLSAFLTDAKTVQLEIEIGIKHLGYGPDRTAALMRRGMIVYSSRLMFFAWVILKRSRNDGGWFKASSSYYELWACEGDGEAFQMIGTSENLSDALKDNVLACRKAELGGIYRLNA